jgi:uncharacterized protein YjiS (DUF1127 family)
MTTLMLAVMGRRVRRTGRRWLAVIGRAIHLSRQRRSLRDLDDHLLTDIGLSRTAARREADRPFWDAPAHWHD